jgi:two-component system chemotaxis sensor kinase CheA
VNDTLLVIFAEEANEILKALEGGVARLRENSGPDDVELIFRAAHTMKGNAGIVGFAGVVELARSMEALLDGMYKGRLNPDALAKELLLKAVSALKDLINGYLAGGRPQPPPDLINDLTACSKAGER